MASFEVTVTINCLSVYKTSIGRPLLGVLAILEVKDIAYVTYVTYVTHTYLGQNDPDIVILHLYLSGLENANGPTKEKYRHVLRCMLCSLVPARKPNVVRGLLNGTGQRKRPFTIH